MRLSRDQTIDFKTVFNSEAGQRVMAVLEDKLHYRSSTAGLNPDGSFDDTGHGISGGREERTSVHQEAGQQETGKGATTKDRRRE